MIPEQKIEASDEEVNRLTTIFTENLSPYINEILSDFAMNHTFPVRGNIMKAIKAVLSAYDIAGRSAGLERIKELEDGLRNLRHGLFSDVKSVNDYIDKLLK